MKKAYIISLVAIVAISVLQGYNIFLQYDNYVLKEIDNANNAIFSSIDEELNLRNRKLVHPDKIGEQHFFYKVYETGEKSFNDKKKQENIINLRSLDAKDLKKKGLIHSSTDILNLIMQDNNLKKGSDINLATLDTIFSNNLFQKHQHIIYLLDKNKHILKTRGKKSSQAVCWYTTDDFAINLSSPRYIRVAINITPSRFIIQSAWTLFLSLLFVIIATFCISYQVREIRSKDKLLKNRELTVNSIIHDLKAPIISIITLMGVAKLKVTDESLLKLTEQISNKVKQLICDIETILTTAGNRHKIILNLQSVNLVELASIAKSDIDILYKDKVHSIVITDETHGNSCIIADKMYMLNVIRNLMENAVKYADNGVCVNFAIERSFSNIQIDISDNGWGISKKDQKLIFNQFYRVPHKNGPRGHGIGLALVKYVIELHDGHIIVNSKIGKGSKFIINIPFKKDTSKNGKD